MAAIAPRMASVPSRAACRAWAGSAEQGRDVFHALEDVVAGVCGQGIVVEFAGRTPTAVTPALLAAARSLTVSPTAITARMSCTPFSSNGAMDHVRGRAADGHVVGADDGVEYLAGVAHIVTGCGDGASEPLEQGFGDVAGKAGGEGNLDALTTEFCCSISADRRSHEDGNGGSCGCWAPVPQQASPCTWQQPISPKTARSVQVLRAYLPRPSPVNYTQPDEAPRECLGVSSGTDLLASLWAPPGHPVSRALTF